MLWKVEYQRDGYTHPHIKYIQAVDLNDAMEAVQKELNKFPKKYKIVSIKPHKYTHLTN